MTVTSVLILYVGLGLIAAAITDNIFRQFPRYDKPGKVVGILSLTWLLPATSIVVITYLMHPEAFGYFTQEVIDSTPNKNAHRNRLMSCGISLGLVIIIVTRLANGNL